MRSAQQQSMEAQQDLTEKIAEGHDADLISSFLGDQLAHRRQQIEKGIFQHLEGDQPLPAEKAIQAWIELHAVHRLEQHLRRRIQRGEAASARIRDQLDGPEEPASPPKRRFLHT